MTDHIYKIIEITGTSKKSMEDAVSSAVVKASESLHNIRWFEVTDIRGDVVDGKIDYWQLTIKLGFTLDNAAAG
jgi:dodecin